MLTIDGAEGGGQLLRSTLALAAVTGTPVTVENVRGSRPEPGLRPQHLAVVETMADVCDADVAGAERGAETVTFEPGPIRPGDYAVDIGTAGSVCLLFDALLPVAARLEAPLSLVATGGTEVKWAPPLSTYRAAKLPLCRQLGLRAHAERERTGYYPTGGGRATLSLAPSTIEPLDLTDRGDLVGATVVSRASMDLADSDVAARQASAACEGLEAADVPLLERRVVETDTHSTGSAVTVALEFEDSRAGFDALGEPGKPAEDVAGEAVDEAVDFLEGSAAVDRYLGDQLLVLLGIVGGRVRVPAVTDHVETSLGLLGEFGCEVDVGELGGCVEVSVE